MASWNIKAFSSLTKKWISGNNDSPKRDFYALQVITEIVSRFDVIAIQEVKGDLRALRYMMKWLGPGWSFLMTASKNWKPSPNGWRTEPGKTTAGIITCW